MTTFLQILLLPIFFLIVTPISLALKLLRIDILGIHFDKRRSSYFRDMSKKNPSIGSFQADLAKTL